jgi:hypothetical protein
MQDTITATVLYVYSDKSLLVHIDSVDMFATQNYSREEIVIVNNEIVPCGNFNNLLSLLGQSILLIANGRDDIGRIVAKYKLMA